MSALEEDHFSYFYEQLKFQEDSCDVFTRSCIARKCLVQSYKASNAIDSNDTSLLLLKSQLREYGDIVDQRGDADVNNYAAPALAIASRCKSESQKWSSQLGDPVAIVERLVGPVGCVSSSAGVCGAGHVTKSDLATLSAVAGSRAGEAPSLAAPRSLRDDPINVAAPAVSKPGAAAPASWSLAPADNPRRRSPPAARPLGGSEFGLRSVGSTSAPLDHGVPETCLTSRQRGPSREVVAIDPPKYPAFHTARDELVVQNSKQFGSSHSSGPQMNSYGCQKKSLGAKRVFKKFVPPVKQTVDDDFGGQFGKAWGENEPMQQQVDERLRNIDPKMVELIRSEIMDMGSPVTWDDIAGLEFAKATIQEAVVWPLLRPDIFTGLRRPPKGILLFGPPGTGKTLIGKCIASQSRSTFFSISASSLTSKWIGEGEKMVRALFAVARCHQPSVVFIDEIDSLLSQRSDTEHESSRRMKTEFLVQLDGATTGEEDRILVVGATNRPQELDEAARRRLVKKLYVPLPEHKARCQIVRRLMSTERNSLTDEEVERVAALTEGYSGADMKSLCQEASMGPIRSLGFSQIQRLRPDEVRPVHVEDFEAALSRVRASVSPGDLGGYVSWDRQYGSGGMVAVPHEGPTQ